MYRPRLQNRATWPFFPQLQQTIVLRFPSSFSLVGLLAPRVPNRSFSPISTSTRCSLSHSDFMVAVNESRPSCEVTAETGSAGTVWCVSCSCSWEDTALTRDGLPVLRKYDSSSITASAASSTFRGRFCLTLKATWEFSICSRNWFSASRSRAFSASSGYALSAPRSQKLHSSRPYALFLRSAPPCTAVFKFCCRD